MRADELIPSEEQEMHVLCDWLRAHGILFAHPANEGRHKPQYRRKQVVLGLQPGLPDLLIFTTPPKKPVARGVAIELKRQRGGTISEAQMRWIEELRKCGWMAWVAPGAERAIEELERLGYGKRTA